MTRDDSGRSYFRRLWEFVKGGIVADAPEEVAMCEFDCRKGQCRHDEWDACERRIRKGAGELFPGPQPPKS